MRDAVAVIDGSVDQKHPLADEIEAQILGRIGKRIRQLQVVVQGGGLVLRGRAPSYYAKQIAQQIAMELGAFNLMNEIEVPATHA